jgi:putative nucleotidyltransferase with HDIG domain
MQSRQAIIQLLLDNGTGPDLLAHVQRVERISQQIADQLEAQGGRVDRQVLEAGALLHDLGLPLRTGAPITIPAFGDKAKGLTSDDINHGITGAIRAAELGFPPTVTRCALRHIPGPSIAECAILGLPTPPEETIPVAIEEKIVSYADMVNWVALLGLNPWCRPDYPTLAISLSKKRATPLAWIVPPRNAGAPWMPKCGRLPDQNSGESNKLHLSSCKDLTWKLLTG